MGKAVLLCELCVSVVNGFFQRWAGVRERKWVHHGGTEGTERGLQVFDLEKDAFLCDLCVSVVKGVCRGGWLEFFPKISRFTTEAQRAQRGYFGF
jgi:hypothetical protein